MYVIATVEKRKYSDQMKVSYLLQADFSVSSSGDTYWAVPTNELALAVEKREKGERSG